MSGLELSPAIANLQPVVLTKGAATKTSTFVTPDATTPKAKVGVNEYPLVTLTSTLDGVLFTATLTTTFVKVGVGPVAVVLQGAVIQTADGWAGAVAPQHCAGTGFKFS